MTMKEELVKTIAVTPMSSSDSPGYASLCRAGTGHIATRLIELSPPSAIAEVSTAIRRARMQTKTLTADWHHLIDSASFQPPDNWPLPANGVEHPSHRLCQSVSLQWPPFSLAYCMFAFPALTLLHSITEN